MRETKPSTSAGVLVMKNGKVLVGLQRQSSLWSIPKGGKEDESFEQCWKRELLEETKINIDECKYDIVDVKDIGGYNVTFIRLFSSPLLQPDGVEIEELKWVSLEELTQLRKNAVTTMLCKDMTCDHFHNFKSCKKRLK